MGWWQLRSIATERRDLKEVFEQIGPLSCPNDVEVLQTDINGRLHCKWDGYVYEGQPVTFNTSN